MLQGLYNKTLCITPTGKGLRVRICTKLKKDETFLSLMYLDIKNISGVLKLEFRFLFVLFLSPKFSTFLGYRGFRSDLLSW